MLIPESVFVVTVVFGSIILFVKIIADAKMRNKLIEKGMLDENVKYLYQPGTGVKGASSLKWGMILATMGMAFFLGLLFPEDIRSEIIFGLLFILGGIALIAYYIIMKNVESKE